MSEALSLYYFLAEVNVDLAASVKMGEFLALMQQGRKPIIATRPSAFLDAKVTQSLAQRRTKCSHKRFPLS